MSKYKWLALERKLQQYVSVFKPMTFTEKYRHVGCSYPGVSKYWTPIVQKAIIKLEAEIWNKGYYLPMWVKRFIHLHATDNTVVRVRNKTWYKIRKYFTDDKSITQIKDKYAGLRIYGHFNDKCYSIVNEAIKECATICEFCGSTKKVKVVGDGWVYRLCKSCSKTIK